MKVQRHTKSLLILRDFPYALWAIGSALLLTGGYLLFELAELRASETPPGAIASLSLLAGGIIGTLTGASFVFGIGGTTVTFDRKGDQLVVRARRLFNHSGWGCTLATIENAALETMLGLDGTPLYRIALITASGRHIPLTPLYVGDRARQERVLLSIRQFLAKEGQRWWVSSVPETAVDTDAWRRVTIFLAGSAVGLLFIAISCSIAMIAAHTELQRYLSVNATVLSTRVESRQNPDGTISRRPVLVSRYVLRDRVYVSDVAPPFDEKHGDYWAFEVVNQRKPGERYTAFYDADHPGKLLLAKPTLTSWYLVATMPVVLLLIVGVSLRTWMRRTPDQPESPAAGKDDLVLIIP